MKCPKCSYTWITRKDKKKEYLGNVFLTDEEFKKLDVKFGRRGAWDRIRNLDDQIAIHGYDYKDHYRVILKWAEKEPKQTKAECSTAEQRKKAADNLRTGKTVSIGTVAKRLMKDIKEKRIDGSRP